MTLTRREFLASMGVGAAALAADAYWVEPNRLDITRHNLGVDPLAPATGTLRLVQLTDLHIQRIGEHEAHVIESVSALRPDVILFTGDTIDRRERLPVLLEFLGMLRGNKPGYAIMGNWDHWSDVGADRLRAAYHKHGIRLLINEAAVHGHAGHDVLIAGVDDFVAGQPDLHRALQGVSQTEHQLLLAHCPQYRDVLSQTSAPTWFRPQHMLSGHTHGGQVTLFGIPAFLPRGSGRYLKGWYHDQEGTLPALYVSRGLGMSGLPIRFWAAPELSLFELPTGQPLPPTASIA